MTLRSSVLCVAEYTMRDLENALADISTIRAQMARSTLFHGYGPATVAGTGLLALAAAAAQASFLEAPVVEPAGFLALWIGAALCGAILTGSEMIVRTRRAASALEMEMLGAAVEQFIPAAVAGALVTLVVAVDAPEAAWMLPGLWQVIFALGVFASRRFLPPAIFWVGAWYLLSGLSALMLARGSHAFSPLAMGLGFGIGQLLSALILQRSRQDAEPVDA